MTDLPKLVTHNYDPARGPFRNLCALPAVEAERILDEIRASDRRTIKVDYLARRHATEEWLYAECSRKLGVPPRRHPIYFFLGDFADGLDPSRPNAIVLPLVSLPPAAITFTYPDSMASLPLGTRKYHVAERRPYHGQVFTLDEIRQVVETFGMPNRNGDSSTCFDRFIEVQLWDDAPLRSR